MNRMSAQSLLGVICFVHSFCVHIVFGGGYDSARFICWLGWCARVDFRLHPVTSSTVMTKAPLQGNKGEAERVRGRGKNSCLWGAPLLALVQEAIRRSFVHPPPFYTHDWPQSSAEAPIRRVSGITRQLFTAPELRSVGEKRLDCKGPIQSTKVSPYCFLYRGSG